MTDENGSFLKIVWADSKSSGENDGTAYFELTSDKPPTRFKCINSTLPELKGARLVKKSNLTESEKKGEDLGSLNKNENATAAAPKQQQQDAVEQHQPKTEAEFDQEADFYAKEAKKFLKKAREARE